ncbi:MAG: shikimate dehydrogenase [Dehalococcoidia bacterium]|nr:shikimate dehydrogenase [Dehalococcoidia bacterium]
MTTPALPGKLAGIIGWPLGHSISPAFHQAAFDYLKLGWRYERWTTPPHQLPQRIAGLRQPHMAGANVTVPHKETVVAMLDSVDPQAKRIGAVNTIVNRQGRLEGHNTDAPGFILSLRRQAAFDPKGARVLVLGAGGAAKAVVISLLDAGAAWVVICNRTPERARRLVLAAAAGARLGWGELRVAPWGAPPPDADLLVNTTTLGMRGGPAPQESPLPAARIPRRALVCDLVYNPQDTPLLAQARLAGARTLGGLPMLIHQGALAGELWTGKQAPYQVMLDAALRALSDS